jgi:hypothetical protein
MTIRVSGFTLISSHLLRTTQLPKVQSLLQGNQELQKVGLQRNSSQSTAVHGSTWQPLETPKSHVRLTDRDSQSKLFRKSPLHKARERLQLSRNRSLKLSRPISLYQSSSRNSCTLIQLKLMKALSKKSSCIKRKFQTSASFPLLPTPLMILTPN